MTNAYYINGSVTTVLYNLRDEVRREARKALADLYTDHMLNRSTRELIEECRDESKDDNKACTLYFRKQFAEAVRTGAGPYDFRVTARIWKDAGTDVVSVSAPVLKGVAEKAAKSIKHLRPVGRAAAENTDPENKAFDYIEVPLVQLKDFHAIDPCKGSWY